MLQLAIVCLPTESRPYFVNVKFYKVEGSSNLNGQVKNMRLSATPELKDYHCVHTFFMLVSAVFVDWATRFARMRVQLVFKKDWELH